MLSLRYVGLLFLSLIFQGRAMAFPEMVRHGYVNCNTCHINVNGGGILTPYGRGLSGELLSTDGSEPEGQFIYGLLKSPDWLHLGGDFRLAQTYRDTTTFREARFIFMQADVEGAITAGGLTADASVGRQELPGSPTFVDMVISRRHYLAYHLTDSVSVQGGKFLFPYGLNLPDHVVSVKRGFGWDQGSETYNLQAAWTGEHADAFVAGVFGRPDNPDLNREQGVSLRSSIVLQDTHKVGLSYFFGANKTWNRHVAGPYAILGFTPHFTVLAEVDLENVQMKQVSSRPWGLANYLKVDYEFFKGIHLFVTQELAQTDLGQGLTAVTTYGGGINYFPRPHFEFSVTYLKQQIKALGPDYVDMAFGMMHFYP
jgi:hypothetical protein